MTDFWHLVLANFTTNSRYQNFSIDIFLSPDFSPNEIFYRQFNFIFAFGDIGDRQRRPCNSRGMGAFPKLLEKSPGQQTD